MGMVCQTACKRFEVSLQIFCPISLQLQWECFTGIMHGSFFAFWENNLESYRFQKSIRIQEAIELLAFKLRMNNLQWIACKHFFMWKGLTDFCELLLVILQKFVNLGNTFFLLSEFSFTNIHDSQDSMGSENLFL